MSIPRLRHARNAGGCLHWEIVSRFRSHRAADHVAAESGERAHGAEPAVPPETLEGWYSLHQVFRLDRRTGRSELITDGKSRHEELLISRDGRRIAWSGTGRNGKDTDVYVADVSSPKARRLTEREGTWGPVDFSSDGTRLYAVNTPDAHLEIFERDGYRRFRVRARTHLPRLLAHSPTPCYGRASSSHSPGTPPQAPPPSPPVRRRLPGHAHPASATSMPGRRTTRGTRGGRGCSRAPENRSFTILTMRSGRPRRRGRTGSSRACISRARPRPSASSPMR